MPAPDALPTIPELVEVFHGEIATRRSLAGLPEGDDHAGSLYDHLAGPGALVALRVAERDRAEFRAIYFDTAEDERLDAYTDRRGMGARIQDEAGAGTLRIRRDTTSAGGGTIWAGTRFAFGPRRGAPLRYAIVTNDVPVNSVQTDLTFAVHAEIPGPSGALAGLAGQFELAALADTLWDMSWAVVSVDIGPGTLRETNEAYRARLRQERLDSRPGYVVAIERVLRDAGAQRLAFFASNWFGDAADDGLNRIFVGNTGWESPDDLLTACRLAMPSVGMCGAAIQILPMTKATLDLKATVTLYAAPDRLARDAARLDARAAVLEYFAARENPFVWSESGVRSAIQRAVRAVHHVDLTSSAAAPTLGTLFASLPLTRWTVNASNLALEVKGP